MTKASFDVLEWRNVRERERNWRVKWSCPRPNDQSHQSEQETMTKRMDLNQRSAGEPSRGELCGEIDSGIVVLAPSEAIEWQIMSGKMGREQDRGRVKKKNERSENSSRRWERMRKMKMKMKMDQLQM